MAGPQEPLLDEIQWKAPPIAQSMGGIQTNTVLPYFYHSPFFDPTSNNAIITTQATLNPAQFYIIQTRTAFEGRLRTMQGLEFMVIHDPTENGTKPDNGGIWVIRKQIRQRPVVDSQITPISTYYVVGENIYMAPSLGRVLEARMLSTVSSLNKIAATASKLPIFTPALGHTYFPPAPKPLTSKTNAPMSQTSKESTPMPGAQDPSIKPQSNPKTLFDLDMNSPRLLRDSLNLSQAYGHEYMDENPLLGEPGSFIITTKPREVRQPAPQLKPKPLTLGTKRAKPQIKTDALEMRRKDGLGAEKSPTSAVTKEKKAKRKSRPAGSTTTPK
ncbi:MAG: hypothetical protein Q9218_006511 [Villophora microphyllina]